MTLNTKNDYSLEGFQLTEEQNNICKNILQNYGGIINSQAGTGKTLTCLTIANHIIDLDMSNTMQVCIVCPVKAVSSFKKELTQEQEYFFYSDDNSEKTNFLSFLSTQEKYDRLELAQIPRVK